MLSSSSYASSGTNASSITAISGTKADGSASSVSSGGATSGGVLDQMAGYLAAALPGRGVAVEQMSIDAFEEQLFRGDGWAANSSGVAGEAEGGRLDRCKGATGLGEQREERG